MTRALQIGAIAVVLAATLLVAFDLDRFLVPKELVLHVTAVVVGLLALRAPRRPSPIDKLLVIYLALTALSLFFAQNLWLGFRALAITASGIVLFLSVRAMDETRVINGLALAVVVACITCLVQAYGLQSAFFASTRAPGGTLGNRNFVAHAAAFGLPLLFYAVERAQRALFPLIGVTIVSATLVLTRSRAAWLATAAMLAAYIVFTPLSKRMIGVALFAAAGVAAALLVPNALRWNSENPYVDSVKGMMNGRGRMTQYERSLVMAVKHPILGVGAGNWPVAYPREVRGREDPSLGDSNPGMTTNPWPSSDWVACVSERGFITLFVVALIFLALARTRNGPLLAVLAATAVAGAFDAVLLLPLPTLIVWSALGALCGAPAPSPAGAPAPHRAPALILALLISLAGAARSTAQLVAMNIYSTTNNRKSLELAARIDPGNYRLQLRLGHRRAAHDLFPNAK